MEGWSEMEKGDYSFSTCWNMKRYTDDGRGMVEEIKELGFQQVELNYNVTDVHLSTIEPMIERGEIGISSVHNVFPHTPDPDYGTDSVLLGFQDEMKRKRAVETLIGSMEYAHRYGAKAVVVHPGEVPFENEIDSRLKKIYREEGPNSALYARVFQEMLNKRDQAAPKYLNTIVQSLTEACEYAAKKQWNIAVGIETRSRCNQIPTLKEAKMICDELAGAGVYLWYDIGHATMMERMGLYDNKEQLQEVLPYIYGVHIHETVGLSDHYCPYIHSQDRDDFDRFLPAIKQAKVKVYELKSICTPEEIHASHNLLLEKLKVGTEELKR